MNLVNVSVLMSVYDQEQPSFLSESLDSILLQTCIPKQIVIVKDGRLTSELDEVLYNFSVTHGDLITITFRNLNKKVNLGIALNEGLKVCNNDLVARMDSDDYALTNRLSLQTEYIAKHPEIKVLGGQIEEFSENLETITGYRKVPTDTSYIKKYARYRNPLNHMTVMFSKSFIESIGGYHDIPEFEDYDLWLRALKENSQCVGNVHELLVAARIGNIQSRRGGFEYLRKNFFARKNFFCNGLINLPTLLVTVILHSFVALTPTIVRKTVYQLFLRRKSI